MPGLTRGKIPAQHHGIIFMDIVMTVDDIAADKIIKALEYSGMIIRPQGCDIFPGA